MVIFMMVNGKIIKKMVRELFIIKMVTLLRAFGEMDKKIINILNKEKVKNL